VKWGDVSLNHAPRFEASFASGVHGSVAHWSWQRGLRYPCRMTPNKLSRRAASRCTQAPIVDPLIPDPSDFGEHYPTRPGELEAELPVVYARHSCGCQLWWTVLRRPEETQGQRWQRMGRIYKRLAGQLCPSCAPWIAAAMNGR